jgi:hypothetical protein
VGAAGSPIGVAIGAGCTRARVPLLPCRGASRGASRGGTQSASSWRDAVMWASPTKSFKQLGGVPTPPPAHLASWTRQLVRAKMFDNLIRNRDPNLGNWLVDPAWNLILIDHTRSFGTDKALTHELTRVDGPLWDRMLALGEGPLHDALGAWLASGEIRAILARRDRMRELVDRLIRAHGEAAVIWR